jgi:hypothetical protein
MTTAAERIREALERSSKLRPGDRATVSIPTTARLADGSPEVARQVFPPMTIEDDDLVRAKLSTMPAWSSYEDAAKDVARELGEITEQQYRDAVHETDIIFFRTAFWNIHKDARLKGHTIVSLGCGHVRCVGCDGRSIYGRDGSVTTRLLEPCRSSFRVRLKR